MSDNIPKVTSGDIIYSAARAIISTFHGGGIWSEVFGCLVEDPYKKRVYSFLSAINVRLEKCNFNTSDRRDDFISSLHRATEISCRINRKVKLHMLQNCIVNGYMENWPFDEIEEITKIIDNMEEYQFSIFDILVHNETAIMNTLSRKQIFDLIKKYKDISRDEFTLAMSKLISSAMIEVSKDIDSLDGLFSSSNLALGDNDAHITKTFFITQFGKKIHEWVMADANDKAV